MIGRLGKFFRPRRYLMNLITAATVLVLCSLAQAEAPADKGDVLNAVPSVSGLKTLHDDMLARVKTVVLEERVVKLLKERPDEDEKTRATAIEAEVELRVKATERARELGAEQTDALDAQLQHRLASVDSGVMAGRLNRALALARTTTIDLAGRTLRYDTRDLRDIERLAAEKGLDRAGLMSLDQTAVDILKPGGQVHLVPHAGKLALILPHPVYSYDEHAYTLGLLPKWVFSSGLELEIRELVPTVSAELELIGKRDGTLRFVAVLSAAAGYRAISFTTFNDNKPFQQYSMSDFRKVGDVLIPYRTVYRVDVAGVNRLVERREVRSARVNGPLAPDAFSIPADYRIQEMAGGVARLAQGKAARAPRSQHRVCRPTARRR
jgi:hypothetical protein